jgi:hypothetical protein
MCGWEEGAQNEIWPEAGCVGGRKGHKMGFGGMLDLWDEERAHNGIWREAGWMGGRREHNMGFWREACEGCGGKLKAGMGAGKIHCKKCQRFFRPQPGCH